MDMISYYESATHLDVSSNTSMGVSGWHALSRLLIQVQKLWMDGFLEILNMILVVKKEVNFYFKQLVQFVPSAM